MAAGARHRTAAKGEGDAGELTTQLGGLDLLALFRSTQAAKLVFQVFDEAGSDQLPGGDHLR